MATAVAIAGAVVATLAAAAAVWQARLVRKQIEHGKDVSVATPYHTIADKFVQLDRFFVDHPELRPYFYENEDMPQEPTLRSRVLSTAELLFDLAESCHASSPVLQETAKDWNEYFAYLFLNSPALRSYADQYAHVFPYEVRTAFMGSSAATGPDGPAVPPESVEAADTTPPARPPIQ